MYVSWCALGLARALASGVSADIELVHPTTSLAPMGVELADPSDRGRLEIGLFGQYQDDPLILRRFGNEVPVVPRRYATDLFVSGGLTKHVTFRVVVPGASQWGSTSLWAANGVAFGDARAGLRAVVADRGHLVLGLRGDVVLPTGAREAWLGEAGPRLILGGLGTWYGDQFAWTVDAGVMARSVVRTEADLELGPELLTGAGGRFSLRPTVDLHASVVSRAGLVYQSGGAFAAEALAGVTWRPTEALALTFGVGHGLTRGYGTTDGRLVTGISWRRPARVEATPEVLVTELDELPEAIEEEIPAGWGDGELARMQEERIEIREPIRFELGTERILEPSLPVLEQVAALLADHPKILHVAIVGHASEEGSYAYNYDLSLRRARSVFEALVGGGVHPDRLSFRGMGETQPVADASLDVQRRVEFRIVAQRRPDEPEPVFSDAPRLPWSGEARGAVAQEVSP